jgi:hypothetical protein
MFKTDNDRSVASPLSPQNQHLLELLGAAPDDDKDAAWWADFERELEENRLSLREIEV